MSDHSYASQSTNVDDAFNRWWNAYSEEHGSLIEACQAAFRAGAAFAIYKQIDREGSSLRGRVITAYRPLSKSELAREDPGLDQGTIWPALELDDGTLVYAYVSNGKVLLGGQKEVDGEIKKVSFSLSVRDIEVNPK